MPRIAAYNLSMRGLLKAAALANGWMPAANRLSSA
jgi:hypothetical protein